MTTLAVQVKMSHGMKQHLVAMAKERGVTLSELIRASTAAQTGYTADDIVEVKGRPPKYATPEERKRAQNQKARERAERGRKIAAALMKQQRLDGAEALLAYLKRQGVTVDDDTTTDQEKLAV